MRLKRRERKHQIGTTTTPSPYPSQGQCDIKQKKNFDPPSDAQDQSLRWQIIGGFKRKGFKQVNDDGSMIKLRERERDLKLNDE